MASQIGVPFQDQNFGVQHKGASVMGKTIAVKPQKKSARLGARKPLGEISNSTNIVPALRQKKSSGFFKEAAAATHEESSKKSTVSSTASGKVHPRGRSVLSDISNSDKAHLHEALKSKKTASPRAVEEDFVSGERFLHDHRKCIKAQANQMDVEEFLAIVGLTNAPSKQDEFPLPLKLTKMKPENDTSGFELEEISEEEHFFSKQKLNSPICKTPKSPADRSAFLEDYEHFELIATP